MPQWRASELHLNSLFFKHKKAQAIWHISHIHQQVMSSRLTSTDASVQQLINRMHELETRRRMSMMHSKEAETRVALAVEEQSRLSREVETLFERESSLKQSLQMLSDEQRQLNFRTDASHRTLESAEREEPLLLQAAMTALDASKLKCANWTSEHESLEGTRSKWSQPSTVTHLENTITDAERELRLLLEEEQSLMAAAAAAFSTTAPSPVASNHLALGSAATIDARNTREDINRLKHTLEEFQSQSARRLTIMGREVCELTNKAVELDKWVSDSTSAVEELKANIGDMSAALQSCRCPACACAESC